MSTLQTSTGAPDGGPRPAAQSADGRIATPRPSVEAGRGPAPEEGVVVKSRAENLSFHYGPVQALKGLNIPRTGRQGRIGVLTTKTLVIAGEGGFNTTPQGRGAMLRAYDKATGEEVGAVFMPAPQTGSPMTYSVAGTQYITVSVSGPGYGAELLVYKLGQ